VISPCSALIRPASASIAREVGVVAAVIGVRTPGMIAERPL
jgi:hypothetical protein